VDLNPILDEKETLTSINTTSSRKKNPKNIQKRVRSIMRFKEQDDLPVLDSPAKEKGRVSPK